MLGAAKFSPCEKYRYTLSREIQRDLLEEVVPSRLACLMLNPSTATADTNDPTVAKCCTYARLWGFSEMAVVNIFAFRSTDPKNLKLTDDPIGSDNNQAIIDVCVASDMILCAWGRHGKLYDRGQLVTGMLIESGLHRLMHYLALNQDGSPAHPLYMKLDLKPKHWIEAGQYAITTH